MIIELKADVSVSRGDGTFYVAHRGRRVNYSCRRRPDGFLVHTFTVWNMRSGLHLTHIAVAEGDEPHQGRPAWL